jgi:S-adenosyl-L-methionine hydrolase (adenosine-forming)
MFILFTDFGLEDPYTGQMKAKLIDNAPQMAIIDLFSNAPTQNPRASSYLLAAYTPAFPKESIFICVVDPGVGGDRPGIIVRANDQWFVGPGNGLFELVLRHAHPTPEIWQINWQPDNVSPTFHGRDIFAPVAAMIANGGKIPGSDKSIDWQRHSDWPDVLQEVIYIDHYGNAITGIGGNCVKPSFALEANQVYLNYGETFTSVPKGQPFWYVNSNGLVEIAVNQGNAAGLLNLKIGSKVLLCDEAHC